MILSLENMVDFYFAESSFSNRFFTRTTYLFYNLKKNNKAVT